MEILIVTHFLNGFLMMAIPLGLAIWMAKAFKLSWRFWLVGAATFILSQVGHLPFNAGLTWLFQQKILPNPPVAWQLPFNAIVLGLSAGLWEEWANYFAMRWWAKDTRSWRRGLFFGAGHGGIEAIILGSMVLLTFFSMIAMRNLDLQSIIPAEQLELAQAQISEYWSLPWYASLLGAVERVFAMIFHLSASLLVMQTFIRRQWFWVWLAVLWHAVIDGTAVWVVSTWGAYAAEGVLAGMTLVSLGIIFALRQPEPPEPASEPPPAPPPLELKPVSLTPEDIAHKIEASRYHSDQS